MIIVVAILAGIVGMALLFMFLKFFGLWFRALLSGAPVGLGNLIGMWIRRVKPGTIVDSRIMNRATTFTTGSSAGRARLAKIQIGSV